jgi:hypothetical protein
MTDFLLLLPQLSVARIVPLTLRGVWISVALLRFFGWPSTFLYAFQWGSPYLLTFSIELKPSGNQAWKST